VDADAYACAHRCSNVCVLWYDDVVLYVYYDVVLHYILCISCYYDVVYYDVVLYYMYIMM